MRDFVRINSKIEKFDKIIQVPGDKSISIRWVMLASLAIGVSKSKNLLESEDVKSAIKAMKQLGIKIFKKKNYHYVYGKGLNGLKIKKNLVIDAGNSGTFARLFCGFISSYDKEITLKGDKSLSRRDFSRVIKPLELFGVNFKSRNSKLPIKILGSSFLRPIDYFEKKGSAQVKSAILFSSLNTPGKTVINCVKSRDHTELMLKKSLKIPIKIQKYKKIEKIEIYGKKNFYNFDYDIPGDISSAAFFIVLTILSKNSKLLIKNVNLNKTRSGIIEIIKRMKGSIKILNKTIYKGEYIGDILVKSTKNLKSINCPKELNTRSIDEFLIIFLLCARAKGMSTFKNIEELRQKESDRLKIASKFLKMIGVKVKEDFGRIKIYGNPNINLKKSYKIKNFLKDHRVFMMSSIAALTFGGNFKIYDKSSIKSSFPNFIEILKNLGARVL